MGLFSNNPRVQAAYDAGVADEKATRETGRFVNTGRKPLERPDDEAEAYIHGANDASS
jgi:hypothetical protein